MIGQSLYVVGSWCRNLLLAVGVLSGGELAVEVKALVLSKATWRILAKCVGSTPPIVLTQLFPVFCAWTRERMADLQHLPFVARVKQMLKQIPSCIWCPVECLNLTSIVKTDKTVKEIIAEVVEGYYYNDMSVTFYHHLYSGPENKN